MLEQSLNLLLKVLLYFLYCQHVFGQVGAERGEKWKVLSRLSSDYNTNLFRYKRDRLKSICPKLCDCKSNENKLVLCAGATMPFIPDTIPGDATSVDLSHNNIKTIEARPLSKLSLVTRLDLSFNKINRIEERAFKDLFRLQWLDLSHNPLMNLSVYDLSESRRSLKTINISYTGLSRLPNFIGDNQVTMHHLTRIVAAHNNITELNSGIIPSSVTHLDLSCLKIAELSGKPFKDLHHLNELVIKGCAPTKSIRSVVDGAFENLESLTHLDLSGNSIEAIPRRLPESLLILDLSNNQIQSIKSGDCASPQAALQHYRVLSNLEEEDSGGAVGSDLSHLLYLSELNLSYNPITKLCSDDFLMLQQLKVLNLTHCDVKSFAPDTFLYAQSLQVLDLSNNQISMFHLSELPDLKELYAERNSIVEVKGVTKLHLPSLKEADFSYNRFSCDCKLRNFVEFLATTYSEEVRFRYLSATSNRYVCYTPTSLSNRPLMSLSINIDLSCDGPSLPLPWPAIAAPISIVVIFITIIVVVLIRRRQEGESPCCCGRSEHNKKVTANKYDDDSDIEIQNNPINDMAILSHEVNQNWVMNSLIPKLQRTEPGEQSYSSDQGNDSQRPLKIEVFSIGKTIQIDTLHRCIDVNRKLALIVTHEFIREESCRYILKVIQERLASDPKDAVICIILDSILQNKMPTALQKLISEKTFLQYPEKERERQEFYFWDKLNSLVFSSSPKPQRPWQMNENDMLPTRHQQRYLDEEKNRSEADTIRSIRRAPSRSEENSQNWFKTGREERLKRLGLTHDGNVIVPEITEGHCNQIISPESPINSLRKPWNQNNSVDYDASDFYAINKDLPMISQANKGGVRSILPASCGDADSIYSEDGNRTLSRQVVRPRERHWSNVSERDDPRFSISRMESTQGPNRNIDVMENLHGIAVEELVASEKINNENDGASIADDNKTEEKTIKRKTNPIKRLKSFF